MSRLLLVLGLVAAAGCSLPRARVNLGYGLGTLDGDVSAQDTSGGPILNAASSTDELGLDDAEGVLQPRISFEWLGFELMLDHQAYSYSGTGTTSVDLEFAGATIAAGDDVASEVDMTLTGAMVFLDVLPGERFRLGLGLGATFVDEEITFTSLSLSPGTSAGSDEHAPVPVVGIHASAVLGPIELDVLARGLSVDVEDVEATFFDLDAGLVWTWFGRDHLSANVRVGWRQVGLEAEYDDGDSRIDLDLEAAGPYVSLGLVF